MSKTYPMDPHLLRTVVRTGSFSAAARELGYTQAAVSQQIASLENDLKVTLLRRRPVATTEAGARLLEHAGPILLRIRAARSELVRLASVTRSRLRVGASPLAAVHIAAPLAEARRAHPRLDAAVQILPCSGIDTELLHPRTTGPVIASFIAFAH